MRGKRRRAGQRRAKPKSSGAPETVVIKRLGRQGDGEGQLANGKRVFVARTLPGEAVHVKPFAVRGDGIAARLIDVVDERPRNKAICAVYDRCGGCQVQHLPSDAYVTWKSDLVAQGLTRQGLEVALSPLRSVPVQSRRRATLAAVRTIEGVVLGFHQSFSDQIVDVASCPLLVPRLDRLLLPLRKVLAHVLPAGGKLDIAISQIGDSIDLGLHGSIALDLAVREALADFANDHDVARIYVRDTNSSPEPVLIRHDVMLPIGNLAVPVPPGCFLQPSDAGEAILQDLVLSGVKGARQVADLFCGLGTFTLPVAAGRAHVFSVDSARDALRALDRAAGQSALGGRVRTELRDLKLQPLMGDALQDMDAVIFDPPRAGAKEQAEYLADCAVPRIVAVSCNPATLGRDLRILVDGGYTLKTVTPVDQFPMSHHVEVVATLDLET